METASPNPIKRTRSDSGTFDSLFIGKQESGTAAAWQENDENIGLYMKSGFCYSDAKYFVPMVIALALVTLWFSDKKSTVLDKDAKSKRQALINDIEELPQRIRNTFEDEYIELYKEIAEKLKNQQDLFLLGKGAGFFAANYASSKFMQVASIHAEAYPSGEFRHGPLSMIDDAVSTPVVFIVLDDEHLSQVLSNILQIKQRGATTIVITSLEDLSQHIDLKNVDFKVQLDPNKSVLAALQAIPPLQMICYYTALARGLNPDQQVFSAIDYAHAD